MIITPAVLEGAHVRMEPVADAHREELRAALNVSPEIWEIYSTTAYGEHFAAFWERLTGMPDRIGYAVRDRASGAIAGTTSFLKIDPDHRKLEIGFTFFRPEFRGTMVNPETKLLMLGTAFDAGCLRVQFSVDTRNERSQAAVAKLGAVREGTVRRHLITWTGHRRDTALFSIIDDEWPAVRARLEGRLAG